MAARKKSGEENGLVNEDIDLRDLSRKRGDQISSRESRGKSSRTNKKMYYKSWQKEAPKFWRGRPAKQ